MKKNDFFETKKNILILTWRDLIGNQDYGGSEVYIDKVANGLTKKGYKVTLFSSKGKNQETHESYDGVKYIRKGSRMTVYFWAAFYYIFNIKNIRKENEFIIDVENGLPFFSPIYSNKPKVMLLHHFHNGQWFIEFPFPFGIIGYCVERFLMPFVYKNTRVVTVSNSSKLDLEVMGIPSKNVVIAYNGTNLPIQEQPDILEDLFDRPTVLYLGRLRSYKRVDFALSAVAEIKKNIPNVNLIIAGKGDDEDRLIALSKQLGIENNIEFVGFVDENEKVELLKKSWVFVNPSSKEGWGVVNIEANHFGTPVVGFNVYGVRDSVKDGVSGFLAENYDDFADKIRLLLSDKLLVNKFGKTCKDWANNFSWDKTVDVFEKEIEMVEVKVYENAFINK